MNKEDIIRMAREAGFVVDEASKQYQPKCIGFTHYLIDDELERFAAIAFVAGAAAEREACVKAANIALLGADKALTDRVLKAIRARGNT